MLDDKQIDESSRIIRKLISDGRMVAPKKGTASFFLEKGKDALLNAKRLLDIGKEENLRTDMWVINTSYYSMFFSATALLAKLNHKIDSEIGIHRLTFHALVHYFIKEENRLKRHFMEEYASAVSDAEDLLQLGEKRIKELISDLDFEMVKRKIFTYEMGMVAERKKAETSYQRARYFFSETEKIIS